MPTWVIKLSIFLRVKQNARNKGVHSDIINDTLRLVNPAPHPTLQRNNEEKYILCELKVK